MCNFFDPKWSTDTRFRRLGKGVVHEHQRVVSSCVTTPPSFVRRDNNGVLVRVEAGGGVSLPFEILLSE